MLFLHYGIIKKRCYPCRLDDIVKTESDSEYSRLSHYNKGLRLLTEALKSKTTQLKGRLSLHPLLSKVVLSCYLKDTVP